MDVAPPVYEIQLNIADTSSLVVSASVNEFIHLRNFLRVTSDTIAVGKLVHYLLSIVVGPSGKFDENSTEGNSNCAQFLGVWDQLLLTLNVAFDCYLRTQTKALISSSNKGIDGW